MAVQGLDIEQEVPLTLEDLFRGGTQRVEVRRRRFPKEGRRQGGGDGGPTALGEQVVAALTLTLTLSMNLTLTLTVARGEQAVAEERKDFTIQITPGWKA